jgi:hypothetical protein
MATVAEYFESQNLTDLLEEIETKNLTVPQDKVSLLQHVTEDKYAQSLEASGFGALLAAQIAGAIAPAAMFKGVSRVCLTYVIAKLFFGPLLCNVACRS